MGNLKFVKNLGIPWRITTANEIKTWQHWRLERKVTPRSGFGFWGFDSGVG